MIIGIPRQEDPSGFPSISAFLDYYDTKVAPNFPAAKPASGYSGSFPNDPAPGPSGTGVNHPSHHQGQSPSSDSGPTTPIR
jgi:hypothetical protein